MAHFLPKVVGGNRRRPTRGAAGGRRASDHGAVADSLPDLANYMPASKILPAAALQFPAPRAQGILP